MTKDSALKSGLIASVIWLGASQGASAHDPRLTEITGLPERAIYSVMQRVIGPDEEQYELLYYSDRVTRSGIAAAPGRICRYIGAHLQSSEAEPTSEILQQNLPEVRKIVVRCD